MTMKVLDNQLDISDADKNFFDIISFDTFSSSASVPGKNKVAYEFFDGANLQYFFEESNIYYSKENDFWFSHLKKNKRIFYAFGLGKPDITDTITPNCVIDFVSEGTAKNSPGVFAQDDKGNIHILIRLNYPDLRKNSFKGSSSVQNLIKTLEGDKKRIFINIGQLNEPDFLMNLKIFINENKNTKCLDPELAVSIDDVNLAPKQEPCIICGKKFSEQEYADLPADLIKNHPDKCSDCLEKIFAVKGVSEIKKHVINFFSEQSLLKKVDNPDLFQSYLSVLKKQDLIKEMSPGVFMFREKTVLEDFVQKYSGFSGELNTDQNISRKSVSNQKCEICGSDISEEKSESSDKKCRNCSRKSYAARALKQIKQYVEPENPFKKDDLLKQSSNRMKFLDYIWTLQEMSLLDHDQTNDSYILKDEEQLNAFIKKYGDSEDSAVEETQKVTEKSPVTNVQRVVKECETCHQKLPVSSFYKSSSSKDGFTNKCKECSRKSYAARALIELKKCVEPEVLFYKKDLLDQCENRMQFLDYLWTMQELDLLEHDEKNDSYILKGEEQLNAFIEKYSDIKPEKTILESGKSSSPKAVKKCETCGQNLPVSSFYKSSSSEDGYTGKCKECSEKNNIIRVLSEIQNFVEPGKSFTKDELLKQVNDPTKVNYYIWTLQEKDLIEYNEKKNYYIIEINDNLKKYQESITSTADENSEKTEELPLETTSEEELKDLETSEELLSEESIIKKEIIHISENNGYTTIMMKGIVKNENVISTMGVFKCISSSINKLFVHRYDENHSDIMIELEIDNNKQDKVLDMLIDKKWENMVQNK